MSTGDIVIVVIALVLLFAMYVESRLLKGTYGDGKFTVTEKLPDKIDNCGILKGNYVSDSYHWDGVEVAVGNFDSYEVGGSYPMSHVKVGFQYVFKIGNAEPL